MSHDTLPVPEPVPMPDFIKPIETRYSGCRFRSRLEARWAVFFDHLGIEWQYEPEGYVVAGKSYLPDFWLPGQKLWVEVKGVIDQPTLDHLMEATDPANGLPATPNGDRWYGSQATGRILMLGQVPQIKDRGWAHSRLDFNHGEPCWQPAAFGPGAGTAVKVYAIGQAVPFSDTDRAPIFEVDALGPEFISGAPSRLLRADERIAGAYRAARMARFEHGENGAPQTSLVELPRPTPVQRRRKRSAGPDSFDAPSGVSSAEILHSAPPARAPKARRSAPKRRAASQADASTAMDHHSMSTGPLPFGE